MMQERERSRESASTISGKRWVRSLPGRLSSLTCAPFLRAMMRKPSCLISCSHWLSDGSLSVLVGRHGAINPAERGRIRNIMPIARDYSRASQSFLFARSLDGSGRTLNKSDKIDVTCGGGGLSALSWHFVNPKRWPKAAGAEPTGHSHAQSPRADLPGICAFERAGRRTTSELPCHDWSAQRPIRDICGCRRDGIDLGRS